jgi:hypothetical protein
MTRRHRWTTRPPAGHPSERGFAVGFRAATMNRLSANPAPRHKPRGTRTRSRRSSCSSTRSSGGARVSRCPTTGRRRPGRPSELPTRPFSKARSRWTRAVSSQTGRWQRRRPNLRRRPSRPGLARPPAGEGGGSRPFRQSSCSARSLRLSGLWPSKGPTPNGLRERRREAQRRAAARPPRPRPAKGRKSLARRPDRGRSRSAGSPYATRMSISSSSSRARERSSKRERRTPV